MTQSWPARLRRGALAGLAGGVGAVAVMWVLVGPVLERAIALEGADGNTHAEALSGHSHAHESGEVVTRLQQQVGGTLTVLVVSVLLGVAFAVVYASTRHRLMGANEVTRSASLGGLAFFALALVPAALVPANPPGVGDPDTVNTRTLTYLLAILLAVIVVGATFAVHARLQQRGGSPAELRVRAVLAGSALAAAVVLLAPRVAEKVPASVPNDLLWQFRTSSLLQLAVMWLVTGLVLGFLEQRARRSLPVARPGSRPPVNA
jgi:predicted cobalt transporter CbtA